MSRTTCRPRLRKELRRGENRFVFVAAMCLGFMVTSVRGGSLDDPAAPTDPASAMYTARDIYNRLAFGTNAPKRAGAFTEPTAGPTAGTMPTTDDIMAKAPTINTNAATSGDVQNGKAYWGLGSGAWGTNTGTRAYEPVPKTGQTTSYAPYDDGWNSTNTGVAWPNPRFTVGTSGDATNCVTDNLTGLMWARNANLASNSVFGTTGKVTWSNAFEVIANSSSGLVNRVSYGGYTDWRLPNVQELHSLIDFGWVAPALCNTAGTGQWTENDPFTGVQPTSYYWSSTTWTYDTSMAWYLAMNGGRVDAGAKTGANYVWPVRGGQ